MAASRVLFLCRKCRTVLNAAKQLFSRHAAYQWPRGSLIASATFFALCQESRKLHLEAPDAGKLSEGALLKGASVQTASAVTTMLTQAAFSLVEAQRRYREAVNVLIQLTEFHLEVLGNREEEGRIWDIVVESRAHVDRCKERVQELEMLFTSVEKLTDASAEVAFLAESEFTSTSLGERLYNAQRHVTAAREESEKLYAELQQVQAESVQRIAEHEDRERRKAEDKERAENEERERAEEEENEDRERRKAEDKVRVEEEEGLLEDLSVFSDEDTAQNIS